MHVRKKLMGVYTILNSINGKLYIGSSKDIHRRWEAHRSHLKYGRHPNKHLQNAYNQYGKEAFTYTVLEEITNDEELIVREQHWIDTLDSCSEEYGYNLTIDIKRRSHNTVTRAKMRDIRKGRSHSAETRLRIGAAQKGRSISHEQRDLLRLLSTGRTPSIETRSKISLALRKRTLSPEHRKKISISARGRAHSEATRAKLSTLNGTLTPVQVIEIRDRLNRGERVITLAKEYGVSEATIRKIKKGDTWKHLL
jgi:group I intron endonuclease